MSDCNGHALGAAEQIAAAAETANLARFSVAMPDAESTFKCIASNTSLTHDIAPDLKHHLREMVLERGC